MSYDEVRDKLKEIKIEDYIWVIYIGIIFLSWYSNSLERIYFIYDDLVSKKKYREILIFIFSILIIIYFYFLKSTVNDVNNIKPTDSLKKQNLVYLSFIASLLIAISGIIFLYIALMDEDINVELAFS